MLTKMWSLSPTKMWPILLQQTSFKFRRRSFTSYRPRILDHLLYSIVVVAFFIFSVDGLHGRAPLSLRFLSPTHDVLTNWDPLKKQRRSPFDFSFRYFRERHVFCDYGTFERSVLDLPPVGSSTSRISEFSEKNPAWYAPDDVENYRLYPGGTRVDFFQCFFRPEWWWTIYLPFRWTFGKSHNLIVNR